MLTVVIVLCIILIVAAMFRKSNQPENTANDNEANLPQEPSMTNPQAIAVSQLATNSQNPTATQQAVPMASLDEDDPVLARENDERLTSMKYAYLPENRYFNDLMEDEMEYASRHLQSSASTPSTKEEAYGPWTDLGLSEEEFEDYLDSTDGGREDSFGFLHTEEHERDPFSVYDDYDDDEEKW